MNFWNIILTDLIPIYVIMILGYVAGKRNAFSEDNSRSFNKLVLNYCLPAALFLSIIKGNREMLFQDIWLFVLTLIILIAIYFLTFFVALKGFKRTKKEAAIAGLIGGAPTIGFLGYAVLSPIYGASASTGLVVAIVAIVVNAIIIPIGLVLLDPQSVTAAAPAAATATATATAATATATTAATTATEAAKPAAPAKKAKSSNAFLNAIKEPVVWSPIIAVILVLCGVHFPKILDPSFELIGKANAGVAVFAAGLTLSAHKFEFDKQVITNTIIKLIIMPALFLLIGKLIHLDAEKLQMLVLAGALPPVFSGIIIGSRYNTYVSTGTASLAVSMLFFIGTAPLWIWLARLVAG